MEDYSNSNPVGTPPKLLETSSGHFVYANVQRRYNVLLSLIGWAHAYNGSWNKELTRNCW